MAVNDLTNTTWVFNSELIGNFGLDCNINFYYVATDTTYDRIVWYARKDLQFYENDAADTVYSEDDFGGWGYVSNTITITGGTDVTNATLISWLEANATQISVSDLTNTTWYFNSSVTYATSSLNYSINFTSNSTNYTTINPRGSFGDGYTGVLYNSTAVYEDAHLGGWVNEAYRTIEITGGAHVTDFTLIAWLEANATRQVQPTGTVLKIYSNDERATAYDIYVQGGTYVTPTKLATVQRPSGYTVSGNYNWSYSGQCEYSLDNGNTWIDFNTFGDDSTFTINNVTQIMFQTSYYQHSGGQIDSQQLNLSISDNEVSQNFVLTQDVTDLVVTSYDD